mgnify:CR=1 FL=1
MNKVFSIAAIILCVALALSGCNSVQTIKAVDGYAEGRIGDTMENSFFTFTVKSAQFVDEYAGYQPKEGYVLLDAVVDMKNVFGETIPMYVDDFQIQWGDGDMDFGYAIDPIDDTMIPLEFELGRAESREYHCVYEVPEGSTEFSISYLEIFEDRRKATFSLSFSKSSNCSKLKKDGPAGPSFFNAQRSSAVSEIQSISAPKSGMPSA